MKESSRKKTLPLAVLAAPALAFGSLSVAAVPAVAAPASAQGIIPFSTADVEPDAADDSNEGASDEPTGDGANEESSANNNGDSDANEDDGDTGEGAGTDGVSNTEDSGTTDVAEDDGTGDDTDNDGDTGDDEGTGDDDDAEVDDGIDEDVDDTDIDNDGDTGDDEGLDVDLDGDDTDNDGETGDDGDAGEGDGADQDEEILRESDTTSESAVTPAETKPTPTSTNTDESFGPVQPALTIDQPEIHVEDFIGDPEEDGAGVVHRVVGAASESTVEYSVDTPGTVAPFESSDEADEEGIAEFHIHGYKTSNLSVYLGEYTTTVTFEGAEGESHQFSASFTVVDGTKVELANTGTSGAHLAWIGGGLLVLGSALILFAKRARLFGRKS